MHKKGNKYIGYLSKASVALFMLITVACEYVEGPGGTGTISGMITEKQYNDDFSLLINSKAAQDKDIFIIYGSDNVVGDKVETTPEGNFEFDYLHEGEYTLYYYTVDKADPSGDKIERTLNISLDKGEHLTLDTLSCFETLDWDEGKASIQGRVREIYYSDFSYWPNMFVEDTILAIEKEVYLTYGDHVYYDERIRTQEDGTFYFNNVIPGEYKVVVYSDDLKGSKQKEAITTTITVDENSNVTYDMGDIFIANF